MVAGEFQRTHGAPIILGVVLALVLASSPVFSASEGAVIRGEETYLNEQAADLVEQARQYDPNFCAEVNRDRDRAAMLYQQAIDAQPGAAINALFYERIAQLYTFYWVPGTSIKPDLKKARVCWQKCIEATSPDQLLWAQAHIGLASSAMAAKDPATAADSYKAVLDIEPDKIVLPRWKAYPPDDTKLGRARREQDAASLMTGASRCRLLAVKQIQYAWETKLGSEMATAAMLELARKYQGTPVGDKAMELLQAKRVPMPLSADLVDQPVSLQQQVPPVVEKTIAIPAAATPAPLWAAVGWGSAVLAIVVAITVVRIRTKAR